MPRSPIRFVRAATRRLLMWMSSDAGLMTILGVGSFAGWGLFVLLMLK